MTGKKTTIFVFINGPFGGNDLSIAAVCEDGHWLAGHICSAEGFIRHDMGFTSKWKHDDYNSHCGEGGWELEYVRAEQIDGHERLQRAFELNKNLGKTDDTETAQETRR